MRLRYSENRLIKITIILTTLIMTSVFSLAAACPIKTINFSAELGNGLTGNVYYYFPSEAIKAAALTHNDESIFSFLQAKYEKHFTHPCTCTGNCVFCTVRSAANSKGIFTSNRETIYMKLLI